MPNTPSFSGRWLKTPQRTKVPLLNVLQRMLPLRLNFTMRLLMCMIACSLVISCGGDADQSSKRAQKRSKWKETTDKPKSQRSTIARNPKERDTAIEVMAEKDIRFNGRLKRYFSLRKFQSVLGEPDSVRLLSDEEPCTTIFQQPDGSVDPEAQYLYKNGSRFECSQGKVAIDEVKFSDGDFIVFNNITLNEHTTLAELKKLFPNAGKNIGIMDVAGEGKLQVMQLREDKENISDGHINIFIKNGTLYSLHWWFPC